MENSYKTFLNEFEKIEGIDRGIDYVLATLQDMAEDKKFNEFQMILNEFEPAKFGDATVTAAMVSWWYGTKLNRKDFLQRSFEYFKNQQGEKEAKEILKGFEGEWKPKFGFERKLFGISE